MSASSIETDDSAMISSRSTSTKRSRPTSSSTSALSVDGRCGSFNGRTCFDSDFGDCCMSTISPPKHVYARFAEETLQATNMVIVVDSMDTAELVASLLTAYAI